MKPEKKGMMEQWVQESRLSCSESRGSRAMDWGVLEREGSSQSGHHGIFWSGFLIRSF